MFTKIKRTEYAFGNKPILVWDGNCGFCAYWVHHWKYLTVGKIEFRTYQETAEIFVDIPLKEFKKASRLVEPDGRVYSGPDSAYRSLVYSTKNHLPFHKWYLRYSWFTWLSDQMYTVIAKHRSFFYKLTILSFGRNPENLKPYWFLYLLLFLAIIYSLIRFL